MNQRAVCPYIALWTPKPKVEILPLNTDRQCVLMFPCIVTAGSPVISVSVHSTMPSQLNRLCRVTGIIHLNDGMEKRDHRLF
jgi:hypothetical protein